MKLRMATLEDAEACLAIYAPYVRETVITFEYEVPSKENFEARMAKSLATHQWWVSEVSGKVVGYAYATSFRERKAYEFTCESSIYLSQEVHGQKHEGRTLATQLYEVLFRGLSEMHFQQVIGVITSPNPQSEKFHEKMGFKGIGTFPAIGFKFQKYHDVVFMQKTL